MIKLREYQNECLEIIDKLLPGSYLVQMATGLGKTTTFANIKREGKVLVLAHREELIYQPIKYYDCPVGIEMANNTSNGEEVVIASVQSIIRRLDKFDPNEFDIIITDEAHHAAADSYKKIYNYFDFRLHLGFTATPNRGDNVRLDDVFSEIIFERDIKWAIKNNYLCDIHCLRANIGYDLSKVSTRMGDFAVGELEQTLNTDAINKAIAEACTKHAKGQTLIFATSVKHAQDIANEIDGAIAITADTKNRSDLINDFTNRKIPVLVNCMIFTEGTDIPLVETIIMARPTKNSSLYTQMVGRGLRLSEGKEKLILIDCVGVTGKADICTAPSLIGVDLKMLDKKSQDQIEGDLFDLPDLIIKKSDTPESWIRNIEIVNLWSKEQSYNLRHVNYFKLPSGDMVVQLPEKNSIVIPAQDECGQTMYLNQKMSMQKAFDLVFVNLKNNFTEYEYIWNLEVAKHWGSKPASEKQIQLIKRKCKNLSKFDLTKLQASQILNRVMFKGGANAKRKCV